MVGTLALIISPWLVLRVVLLAKSRVSLVPCWRHNGKLNVSMNMHVYVCSAHKSGCTVNGCIARAAN